MTERMDCIRFGVKKHPLVGGGPPPAKPPGLDQVARRSVEEWRTSSLNKRGRRLADIMVDYFEFEKKNN